MGVGNIVNNYICHAFLTEFRCQRLCGGFCIAVHGSVGDHYAFFFRLVAAPAVIFFDKICYIGTPYGTVKGADHFDIQAGGLLEEGLDGSAVFAYNIGVVASCVVDPVSFKVHFIIEQLAVQGAEGAESICGEEDAGCHIEGDHGFGPMHHGGIDKGYRMSAKALGIALVYFNLFIIINVKAELTHQHEGLGGADNFYFGVAEQDFFDGCAVIRFHMVDYQVIQLFSLKQIVHVFQQLSAGGPVYGIEQHRFFIQKQISIIGNASGNGMNIFKKGKSVVIGAHPV